MKKAFVLNFVVFVLSCSSPTYDLVVHNGVLFDGTGSPGKKGMVGVINDKIQYIGPETSFKAATSIDAKGKAISPGFINMLSWGYNSIGRRTWFE